MKEEDKENGIPSLINESNDLNFGRSISYYQFFNWFTIELSKQPDETALKFNNAKNCKWLKCDWKSNRKKESPTLATKTTTKKQLYHKQHMI